MCWGELRPPAFSGCDFNTSPRAATSPPPAVSAGKRPSQACTLGVRELPSGYLPSAVPGRCCSLRGEQTWDAAGGSGVGRLPAGEGGFQPGGAGSGHPFPQRIAAVLGRQLVAELRCPQLFMSDRCSLWNVGKKVQKGVPMLFSSLESELYNFCFAVDPE